MWQAQTFGLTLAGLELRQSSDVHAGVVAECLEAAGQGDHPAARGDAVALDRLATDGWPDGARATSERGREVLATFRTLAGLQARWGPRVCRRYVVSHTEDAAHLVAVRALARLAVPQGRELELDVVPLLESVADLERGTEVLDAWVDLPGEAAVLDAHDRPVEVMLGYSDSAKGAGPASAALTLYAASSRLVAWAERRGRELTLFHGRGGALGRGGGPAHRALLAQAPGSVAGRFKVTEQGEIVLARYGDRDIAERHLEQVTAATLLAESPGAPGAGPASRRGARGRAGDRGAGLAEGVRGPDRTRGIRRLRRAPRRRWPSCRSCGWGAGRPPAPMPAPAWTRCGRSHGCRPGRSRG